jgi:hypothetical protein
VVTVGLAVELTANLLLQQMLQVPQFQVKEITEELVEQVVNKVVAAAAEPELQQRTGQAEQQELLAAMDLHHLYQELRSLEPAAVAVVVHNLVVVNQEVLEAAEQE